MTPKPEPLTAEMAKALYEQAFIREGFGEDELGKALHAIKTGSHVVVDAGELEHMAKAIVGCCRRSRSAPNVFDTIEHCAQRILALAATKKETT